MNSASTIDPEDFQRLLGRNLKLPLAGGVLGAVVFVALIVYLLWTISWVEHTDRVTRNAVEVQRRSVDMETGMRGFLITGDDSFLEPYDSAQARMKTDLAALRSLVSDNQQQVDRIDRIGSLQNAWNDFAREMIALRRGGGDYQTPIRFGRGKRITDNVRAEFTAFTDTEQALRFQRNNEANRTAWAIVGLFVFFTLLSTGLLAFFGRRQLLRLSESYDVVLKEQAAHAETLQQQAWLRSAQTELTADLVGELSAQDMGRKVLDFFAQKLGSTVGALYQRERHGALRRVASYGFSSDAEATPQVLSPTESLVGQAASHKRLQRDRAGRGRLPQGQFRPGRDGAGSRAAAAGRRRRHRQRRHRARLHAPARRARRRAARAGGRQHRQRRSTAARYRERLQDALAETQQLNEELQVQQEELRTANEELEEQSRALQRVAGAPGKPAGRAGADQRAARRAAPRRWTSKQRRAATQAQARARGARRRTAAREPLQVRVPRQHVARAAHAAQQLADPRQAAGGQRAGQPQRGAGEVRRVDLRAPATTC